MSDPFLGEIKVVGFNFAPRGYATCQGQLISIAQNSALFSLLSTTFGGDGNNTFGLPNFQGRSPVGMGNGAGLSPVSWGQIGGNENASILAAQMPAHTHAASAAVAIPASAAGTTVSGTPGPTAILGPSLAGGRPATLYSTNTADTTLQPFDTAVTVQAAGQGQPFPIRNPYLGINFVIALQGIFPSRD